MRENNTDNRPAKQIYQNVNNRRDKDAVCLEKYCAIHQPRHPRLNCSWKVTQRQVPYSKQES